MQQHTQGESVSRGRRMRRAGAKALAGVWLAVLAGCGGGGTPSGGMPPVPAPDVAWKAAEISQAGQAQLLAWNTQAPGVRLLLPVQAGSVVTVPALEWSAGARTVTERGQERVFFVQGGVLHGVDLRAGQVHADLALPQAGAVCRIASVEPLDSAGAAALISLYPETAPDGTCTDALRLVQVSASAQVQVHDVSGERLLSPLRLPDGQLMGLLMAVKTGPEPGAAEWPALRTMGSGGAVQWLGTPPTAASGPEPQWLGQDSTEAGLGYLRAGQGLWALRWSAGGAGLGVSPLATLTRPTTVHTTDASGVYFNNGPALWAAQGGVARPVAELNAAAYAYLDQPDRLIATRDHLVLRVRVVRDPEVFSPVVELLSVAKAGGGFSLLRSHWPEFSIGGVTPVAAVDDQVLMVQTLFDSAGHNWIRMASLNPTVLGAASTPIAGAALGLLWQETRTQGAEPALSGLLLCGTESGTCSGDQTLWQWQVAAPAQPVALGILGPTGGLNAWVTLSQTHPTALVLADPNTLVGHADAWMFTPGRAGSLQRLSTNLP